MPHLAAGERLRLPVKVKAGARLGGNRARHVATASPIRLVITASEWRAGSPSGQPADRANVLLELGAEAGVRSPMPGIVDARRDFIDEQPLFALGRDHEHLHREDADMAKRLGDPTGKRDRRRGGGRRKVRRHLGLRARIPPAWTFSATSKARMAPSPPRATITDISRSKATNDSSIAGTSPIARQAETGSSPARITAWPLPS